MAAAALVLANRRSKRGEALVRRARKPRLRILARHLGLGHGRAAFDQPDWTHPSPPIVSLTRETNLRLQVKREVKERSRSKLPQTAESCPAQAALFARTRSSALAIRPTPSGICSAGTLANERRRLELPPSSMKSGPAMKVAPSSFAAAASSVVSTSSGRSSQRK